MESTARELLFSGSFGAGKSRVGCEKGLFLSLKYPGNFGAIFRKTMTSLRITTMQTWFRDVCPPEYIASFNQLTNICKLINGSQVVFLGLDDPQKIGSLELGWAFIDEAVELDEDDYLMILSRLRLSTVPFRQLFAATNPGSPSHFLYQRFYVQRIGEYIESNTLSNPYLPEDYVESLRRLTGPYYDRYVLGKWVGFEGLVYDCFSPERHLVDPFEIPADWPRYRSIDFGYTNPFVCQWWAKHPERENCQCPAPVHKGYYLYREIYMSGRVVEDHAHDIMRFTEPVVATFADWAAGDRAILERCGIPTLAANKDIRLGIQAVYKALSEGRLHFFRNALVEEDSSLRKAKKPTCTVEEFSSYAWAKSRMGHNDREVPADKDNHGMDALRYFILSLEGRVQPVGQVHYGTKSQTLPLREWGKQRAFVGSWIGR